MSSGVTNIGIVGVGEIALNQHVPCINSSPAFQLIGTASRNGGLEGIKRTASIDELIVQCPDLGAVAVCTPPKYRFDIAKAAIEAGKHVLLEKPPASSIDTPKHTCFYWDHQTVISD